MLKGISQSNRNSTWHQKNSKKLKQRKRHNRNKKERAKIEMLPKVKRQRQQRTQRSAEKLLKDIYQSFPLYKKLWIKIKSWFK